MIVIESKAGFDSGVGVEAGLGAGTGLKLPLAFAFIVCDNPGL